MGEGLKEVGKKINAPTTLIETCPTSYTGDPVICGLGGVGHCAGFAGMLVCSFSSEPLFFYGFFSGVHMEASV